MHNSNSYLVPPKLQQKLLLARVTIPELAVAFLLGVLGFFSDNKANTFIWTSIWMICVARLFGKRSLLGIVYLMLRYHFLSPRQFVRTRRKQQYAKSKH